MSLLDLSARELMDRFASPDPTPGGGSASALAGSLGAALVAMVCAMPKTRTGTPEERSRLEALLGRVREAGGRLRRLVDEDSAAYDAVMAAHRLAKGTEEERSRRKAAIAEAMSRATEVPLETAEACLAVLNSAVEAAAQGNPDALSDARTGGALALAGLLGALENVRINTRPQDGGAGEILAKAEALGAQGRERGADLGLPLGP